MIAKKNLVVRVRSQFVNFIASLHVLDLIKHNKPQFSLTALFSNNVPLEL